MSRSRPCRICRRWFIPHPRAGDRQRACSKADCQQERHRLACQAWRCRHPEYDREDRLRRRLRQEEPGGRSRSVPVDPLQEIDWSVARDAVGLQVVAVIEETGQVLRNWARDAVTAQAVSRQSVRPEKPHERRETASSRRPVRG